MHLKLFNMYKLMYLARVGTRHSSGLVTQTVFFMMVLRKTPRNAAAESTPSAQLTTLQMSELREMLGNGFLHGPGVGVDVQRYY